MGLNFILCYFNLNFGLIIEVFMKWFLFLFRESLKFGDFFRVVSIFEL